MRCEADPIWGAFSETSAAPLRVALSRGTESPGQGQPTALSCASPTVESEAGEGAMPRATGRFAQLLRPRGCVNARMNVLTIWDVSLVAQTAPKESDLCELYLPLESFCGFY